MQCAYNVYNWYSFIFSTILYCIQIKPLMARTKPCLRNRNENAKSSWNLNDKVSNEGEHKHHKIQGKRHEIKAKKVFSNHISAFYWCNKLLLPIAGENFIIFSRHHSLCIDVVVVLTCFGLRISDARPCILSLLFLLCSSFCIALKYCNPYKYIAQPKN